MRTLALYQMLFGLVAIAVGVVLLAQGSSFSEHPAPLLLTLVGGVILVGTGLRLQKGWRPGLVGALVMALGIGGNFGYYWIEEGSPFFPSALLTIMAIVSILLVGLVAVQPKQRKREF